VNWEVTPGQWSASWGGDKNHFFDQPGRIYALGIDYAPRGADAEIYLISLTAQIAGGEKVLSRQTLYSFDHQTEKFGGGGDLALSERGLLIANLNGEISAREQKNELTRLAQIPMAALLDAQLLSGAARVWFQFNDAAGKTFVSETRELALGKNSLVFPLGAALADAAPPLRVERIRLSGAGAVLLTDSKLETPLPPAQAVTFAPVTGNALRVLKKGEEAALRLRFTNTALDAGAFNFAVTFTDFFSGATVVENFSATLGAGETREFTPEWRPQRFGHYDIAATVSEQAAPEITAATTRSIAYLEPAGPTPGRAEGFLFSICSHTGAWANAERTWEAEAAALCGAKVMRLGATWGGVQPERGAWRFANHDKLVADFGARGIELELILSYTPRWAAPAAAQATNDPVIIRGSFPDLEAWREYVGAMAERYRGLVRFWEIWNEPDMTGFSQMTVPEYAELQKIAYQEIKKAAPEAKVMTGGFATMSNHPSKISSTFHRDFLVEAKGSYDIHAHHEHGAFAQYAPLIDDKLLPMRQETGADAVPWYANETAVNSMNGARRLQAITLYKKLLFSWARGAIGYTWYDLRDDGYDPFYGEHHYGMITNNFFPKPVYTVFNMLASTFRGAEFVEQLTTDDVNQWLFSFRDPAGALLAAWEESVVGAATVLVIDGAADGAALIDLAGNRATQPVLSGMTLLSVTNTPQTLALSGARDVKIAGKLLALKQAGIAAPGKPIKLAFDLFNPLPQAQTFNLNLEALPAGLTPRETQTAVVVAPRQTTPVELTLDAAPNFAADFGAAPTLRVVYEIADTPWRGVLPVTINAAVVVPRGDGFAADRQADFILDQTEQTITLVGADPATAHRVWKNAEDLSARIYLGDAGDHLQIRLEVTDDTHHQPERGASVFRGDNVQLAWQFTGQSGYWEVGLSRVNDGAEDIFIFDAPKEFNREAVLAQMKLRTTRSGAVTSYNFSVPKAAIGLTPAGETNGFRFNALINDNDGEGRDGWIHISPGIGENKNPQRFPFVIFE
jgi:hypothetical protein